jgi:hypothetical protein
VKGPRIFISYSHADGTTAVRDFWASLSPFLNRSGRQWNKWEDHHIQVGQDWDQTIRRALEQECNCCLLLVSDLFARSSYILDIEWPKTLLRYEREGILFFPVVFGILEGESRALPQDMLRFQVFWPTVAELYNPPPSNVPYPDRVHQCYKDVMGTYAARERFLSRLAGQMNDRFDAYLTARAPMAPQSPIANGDGFVTIATEDDKFAKAIFGPFSYEKRFRDSPSRGHYFSRSVDAILDERLSRNAWILVAGHPLAGKTRAIYEAFRRLMAQKGSFAIWPFHPPPEANQPLSLPTFPNADRRIVWLDDIDARFRDLLKRGYSSSHINAFLEAAAAGGVMLWATIRTGPTYYDFRHRFGLEEHLWDKLEAVIIPRVEGEEERRFDGWYQASFGAPCPKGSITIRARCSST